MKEQPAEVAHDSHGCLLSCESWAVPAAITPNIITATHEGKADHGDMLSASVEGKEKNNVSGS